MKSARAALLFTLLSLPVAPIWAQIGGGNCNSTNLAGSYRLTLNGRAISAAGVFTGSFQSVGTATFDGQGGVTLAGTANTNLAQGQDYSYTGTYSLPSNCFGAVSITTTSAATFSLVVWQGGRQFDMVGSDATYVYSGNGSNVQPDCGTPTLSGEYVFTASGFASSGNSVVGVAEEAGVLQFDGQGNVTAKYTDSQGGTMPASLTASGTYNVSSFCSASATLGDSGGKANAWNLQIAGLHGENLFLITAGSTFLRAGAAHSAFTNPGQAIGNVASYAYSATPPGSVFVVFGQNLATEVAGAANVPLPTKLLDTTVTVDGELAPLFYVSPGQIDAQMPWDASQGVVLPVIVTNGNSTSNAAAVFVPGTGTPGISVYGNNRAVVVNSNGSVNSGASPAAVGDEVVVYFTGGGAVNASGNLITGAPSPGGLSPVTGDNSITVGKQRARIDYIGLTPGSIGLYQANFFVPQLPQGTYQVVITIDGQASNKPVMSVSN